MVEPGAAVLAVDGGNSKTDLALVGTDGQLLAGIRGPTISHQAVGLEEGITRLAGLVGAAVEASGRAALGSPVASRGVFALAGADYPSDVRLLTRAIQGLGLAGETIVVNDTLAALRAGSRRPWGIALICGQGVNGVGVGVDGRVARFDGVGELSGDWGGGTSVGQAGHAAAVRARDGRGPRTRLERLVPEYFGLGSPGALVRAFYHGRIDGSRLGELSPVVFRAATDGDAVARSIVDRLADELGTMAAALIRRVHLVRRDPDVVLAGGVFRTDDARFHARLAERIAAVAPAARIVRLEAPPVLGAVLLGLDRQGSLPGGHPPAEIAVVLGRELAETLGG